MAEPEKYWQLGICYECSTKDGDSAEKRVNLCKVCKKWFCDKHLKPKFPYFVDWDTVFDVQGNPEVKAAFHTEYGREDGHADFVYMQTVIEAFEIEEKKRNELIKQAMDRMMHPENCAEPSSDTDDDKEKRVYLLVQEESELDNQLQQEAEPKAIPKSGTVKTYDNIYHHDFLVPAEIYAIEKYRDRFNHATCLEEVEAIIDEYRNPQPQPKIEETPKKKRHWWQ